MNWKIQPITNSASDTFQNQGTKNVTKSSGREIAISGMPTVWQKRFTGC
jgi:hypothetical protein